MLLWYSWRDAEDAIPDSAPRLSPNEKISTKHSRSRKRLYDAVLFLCAGVRLLSNRTITLRQARTGQQFLVQFCKALLALGVSLVINHHLCMHYYDMIYLFGPIYAWWLFTFERFNGMMEKVKHNGHDGGVMELTLLRNWVQTQLIYDLLVSLPAETHQLERQMLERRIELEGRQRGSMIAQIAVFQSEVDTGETIISCLIVELINGMCQKPSSCQKESLAKLSISISTILLVIHTNSCFSTAQLCGQP